MQAILVGRGGYGQAPAVTPGISAAVYAAGKSGSLPAGKRCDIPILLDRPAIEAVCTTSDTAVTWTLRGVSLASALDLILAEHGLTYMVRDEVLVLVRDTQHRHRALAQLLAGLRAALQQPGSTFETGTR